MGFDDRVEFDIGLFKDGTIEPVFVINEDNDVEQGLWTGALGWCLSQTEFVYARAVNGIVL